MANEVVHDADAAIAATVELTMEEEARVGLVIPKFLRPYDISSEPTLAKKISKHPVTADAGTLTDGTAASNTAINPTSVTLTAAGVILGTDVTDFSATGSLLDVQEAIANFLRATLNKVDVDSAALLGGFSTTVGTSGTNASVANLMEAFYQLLLAKELKGDALYGLHPIQYSDVAQEIAASSAPVFSTDAIQEGFLKLMPGDPNFRGTFMGVPVFSDPNIATANGGADRAGALFRAYRALGIVWKWGVKAETQRVVKMAATSAAVHACYGVGEIHDGAGVSIITDA
jgi:hypothetical protein